jgi:hypothetical protein
MATATRERPLYLWALAASPAIWAAHFLLSYATAAVWCAKVAGVGGSLLGARIAIGAFTAVALAGIGYVGWDGHRRHRYGHGGGSEPHDDDSPEDRHRFLGYATVLLSALSAVATIYAALVVIFIGSCD